MIPGSKNSLQKATRPDREKQPRPLFPQNRLPSCPLKTGVAIRITSFLPNPTALPNVSNNWLLCTLAERDVAAARLALAACGKNPILLSSNENVIFPQAFAEGLIARLNHDDEKARGAFAAAHAEQEKIVQARATYGPALCVLGLIDAALGKKEQALQEGRRAVELVRAEKDSVAGATMTKYL